MRKPPASPPPDLPTPQVPRAQVRRYELITPLFGGGVTPGRFDALTAVRGTIIRGQLRFWWRATRGGRYATVAELHEAEACLWGAASDKATSRPSLVQIAVSTINAGHDFVVRDHAGRQLSDNHGDPISVGHFRSPFSYVAFPLQQTRGVVREGIAFTLTISVPEHWPGDRARHFAGSPGEELAAALWAWETFGGIGARTRRGFGALRCIAINTQPFQLPAAADLETWLLAQVQTHVLPGGGPPGLPRLSRDPRWYRLVPERTNPHTFFADSLQAWQRLFNRLKEFRQPRPPSSADPKRPGRSRWPEPEAIRQITRRRLPRHQPMPTSGKFPRAAFGLPIIFQFKDQGDPDQTSLQGVSTIDRLASPLILRPLVGGDKKVVGLAIVLEAPRTPPGGLSLIAGRHTIAAPDPTLTPDEAAQIMDRGGRTRLLGGMTDVLEAFLKFL
jgi:CRISPR-associated protein Cmr1